MPLASAFFISTVPVSVSTRKEAGGLCPHLQVRATCLQPGGPLWRQPQPHVGLGVDSPSGLLHSASRLLSAVSWKAPSCLGHESEQNLQGRACLKQSKIITFANVGTCSRTPGQATESFLPCIGKFVFWTYLCLAVSLYLYPNIFVI